MKRWLLSIASLLLPGALAAQNILVTRCGTDSWPGAAGGGAPYDLSRAIPAASVIGFNCGVSTTLHITSRHDVPRALIIDGGGTMVLTGDDLHAFFRLLPGAKLTLRRITLEHGYWPRHPASLGPRPVTDEDRVSDAGIVASAYGGDVVIENSVVRYSARPIRTAGGTLTIRNSTFDGNTDGAVEAFGGKVEVAQGQFLNNHDAVFGGALYSTGSSVVVRDKTNFTNNQAMIGGAMASHGSALDIADATFTNNTASMAGALLSSAEGSLRIAHCRFEGNRGGTRGGAIAQTTPIPPAVGQPHIAWTTFANNTSALGGAIAFTPLSRPSSRTTMVLRRVIFAGNHASGSGGAIAAASASVDVGQAIFARNTADGPGSAVSLDLSDLDHASRLVNSLLVQGTAGGNGASLSVLLPYLLPASGSGSPFSTIRRLDQRVEVINSTIADNGGGGVRVRLPSLPTRVLLDLTLANTIVSGNAGGNCAGRIPSNRGHNLQFPGADCGAGIRVASPVFGSRYAPLDFSPARDAGDDTVCAAQPINGVDLFGEKRNGPGHCTIGAVERDVDRLFPDKERRNRRGPG